MTAFCEVKFKATRIRMYDRKYIRLFNRRVYLVTCINDEWFLPSPLSQRPITSRLCCALVQETEN